MGAHVNLIPINPVDGSPYSAADAANVRRFQNTLLSLGVNATVRRRLGTEISAACGQLRREANKEGTPANGDCPPELTLATNARKTRTYRAQARTDGKAWLAVCDGMGTARGRRLASSLAVASLEQTLCAGLPGVQTDKQARALLEQAVRSAQTKPCMKKRWPRLRPAAWAPRWCAACAAAHAAIYAWAIPHLPVSRAFHLPAHKRPFHRAGAGGKGSITAEGSGVPPAQRTSLPAPWAWARRWRWISAKSCFPQATSWCCARTG